MLAPYQSNSAPITVADTPPHDAARRLRLPADQEILDKMLELHGQGITRDQAAKLIRTLPGFEGVGNEHARRVRSEEHTSELQSLMRISYAVFCLKKKKNKKEIEKQIHGLNTHHYI